MAQARPYYGTSYKYDDWFGRCARIDPLKTDRSHVRGGDLHPCHLNKHRGYARLGIRGAIRQRRRYFKDLLEFLKELPETLKNISDKIKAARPN